MQGVYRVSNCSIFEFYRVFKAKYFPNFSIFEEKSSSGFFAWKSILHSRKLIAKESRWRIGDGKTTRIFYDSWLLDSTNGNILPTRESLHRRRVNVDVRCELCCQQPESAGHLLWKCPFARNIWALCPRKIQKCPNDAYDFFLLFKTLVQRLFMKELEIWAVVSWGIWNARNRIYLERVQPHPKAILVGAVGFLQEYQNLNNAQRNSGVS